jgi:hypothetical protein
MREYQVRICEGLGVKFPGPTRHEETHAPQQFLTLETACREIGALVFVVVSSRERVSKAWRLFIAGPAAIQRLAFVSKRLATAGCCPAHPVRRESYQA